MCRRPWATPGSAAAARTRTRRRSGTAGTKWGTRRASATRGSGRPAQRCSRMTWSSPSSPSTTTLCTCRTPRRATSSPWKTVPPAWTPRSLRPTTAACVGCQSGAAAAAASPARPTAAAAVPARTRPSWRPATHSHTTTRPARPSAAAPPPVVPCSRSANSALAAAGRFPSPGTHPPGCT